MKHKIGIGSIPSMYNTDPDVVIPVLSGSISVEKCSYMAKKILYNISKYMLTLNFW